MASQVQSNYLPTIYVDAAGNPLNGAALPSGYTVQPGVVPTTQTYSLPQTYNLQPAVLQPSVVTAPTYAPAATTYAPVAETHAALPVASRSVGLPKAPAAAEVHARSAPRAEVPVPTQPKDVHSMSRAWTMCDGCGMLPIRGTVHSCDQCTTDYCERCYLNKGPAHAPGLKHTFAHQYCEPLPCEKLPYPVVCCGCRQVETGYVIQCDSCNLQWCTACYPNKAKPYHDAHDTCVWDCQPDPQTFKAFVNQQAGLPFVDVQAPKAREVSLKQRSC